jgi:K+-sensing histidine kinase KdpD
MKGIPMDKSRKRGQGTGLGLAIAREIIETHGGMVRAESIEGVGTKVSGLLCCPSPRLMRRRFYQNVPSDQRGRRII